jgi:hypothetical protein
MFTTEDSMVVKTEDALFQFVLMHNKRMNDAEDATTALTAKHVNAEAKLSHLEAKIDTLRTALEARPRPEGFSYLLVVPTGTTQKQVEQDLKARCAELGLAMMVFSRQDSA